MRNQPGLIGGAVGGALVAGGFSVYNRVSGRNDEHGQWLRDQKVESYSKYLDNADMLLYSNSTLWSGRGTEDQLTEAFSKAQSSLEIVAHPSVRVSAAAIGDFLDQLTHEVIGQNRMDQEQFKKKKEAYALLRERYVEDAQRDLNIVYFEQPISGSELTHR